MAHPRPTVSAVITTFNYAAYIRDALDSVLAQEPRPDEVLVIDDGSTDNTREIVGEYARDGVKYVAQDNAGAGAARNRGIAESSGDLIAFLDADDVWLPGKIAAQVEYLQTHPDAVVVTGQKIWWDVERDTQTVEQSRTWSEGALRRQLTVQNVVGNPSMALIRRSALLRVGPFDERLRWGQDWEMFIRLAREGAVGVLRIPVILYRWHPQNLTHHRRWERLDVIHGIGRRAIEDVSPSWWRPILRARLWSAIEFDRARIAIGGERTRAQAVWYAFRSLMSFPFDQGMEKAKHLIRAVIGERLYARLRGRIVS